MGERVAVYRRSQIILVELLLLTMLVSFCWLMARSTYIEAEPQLIGSAIMVDLTFTAALCHVLLGVRRGGLPRWTLIPVLAGGLALGRVLLPEGLASTGLFTLVAVAVVECCAFTIAVVNFRKVAGSVRAAKRAGVNGFDALEAALLDLIPSAPLFASYARFELQVWVMCMFGWLFAPRPADGPNVFTHHKAPHWFVLLGLFMFLVLVEGLLAHYLLGVYHFSTARWIFAAISGYTLVWLHGDLQALRVYRSSLFTHDGEPMLDLRIGARGHATIPVRNIASIELGSWEKGGPGEQLFVLFGKANVKLSFHEPSAYKPAFGAEKRIATLLTQVDDPTRFQDALARVR